MLLDSVGGEGDRVSPLQPLLLPHALTTNSTFWGSLLQN